MRGGKALKKSRTLCLKNQEKSQEKIKLVRLFSSPLPLDSPLKTLAFRVFWDKFRGKTFVENRRKKLFLLLNYYFCVKKISRTKDVFQIFLALFKAKLAHNENQA